MSRESGKQVFDWMEQIPEAYILEAERDPLTDEPAPREEAPPTVQAAPGKKSRRQRLAGGLKYLPVAASIVLVIGGGWYLSENFLRMGSAGNNSGMGIAMEESQEAAVLEGSEEEASEDDRDAGAEQAGEGSIGLPTRCDIYDGPVLAMTATGDDQKLRTIRRLTCEVDSQLFEQQDTQPILRVADRYQIENRSDEDKTLQLVYPYVTTLNRGYDLGEPLLTAEGQEIQVRYCAGDGVASFLGRERTTDSTARDYEQLLSDPENTYQEQALSKDADWDRQMAVYTFSDFTSENLQQSLVMGITVEGADTDVFTYGFDYESEEESGALRYSLFVPAGEPGKLVLLAPAEAKLDIGYYTNLDWEDTAQGVDCQVTSRTMTLSAALRLCSAWYYRKLQEDGVYADTMPGYRSADVLYQALTKMSGEEQFYDTLTHRYGTSELMEVFSQLIEETRIVYGLATVTIPAGEMLEITAHIQKRQTVGNYVPVSEAYKTEMPQNYTYDVFAGFGQRLGIAKTVCSLKLEEGWKLIDDDLGLAQKENGVWKAVSQKESQHMVIGR